MFDKIREAFSQFTFLNPKDVLKIATIARIRTVAKDVHLIQQGDRNYNVMVVLKGLLRQYTIDKNGVDRTLRFVPEKFPTASMDTIFLNKAAAENIVAMENSLLMYIDFQSFEKLAVENIRISKVLTRELKTLVASNVMQIRFLSMLTPEERYIAFCNEYPHLEQRIKQKYLASYIGVTPTSLSRMKARLIQ
jgi:CRP-like cAMP-binding protein